MSSSKKILIVSYYWPPSGGVGVQRWMNFAIQLKKRGWEPWILTPENPQFEIRDNKLLEKVKDIPVVKVPIWEPFDMFHRITGNKDKKNVQQGLVMEKSQRTFTDRLVVWIRGNLLVPDPRVFWVRPAAKRAIELVKNEGFSTIITTGPPHSMHLIGKRVKNKTGIKWLADFRDPWSKWDVLDKLRTSSLVRSIHRKLERSVLREADQCLTVSPRLAEALGGIHVLNNGVTINGAVKNEPNEACFTIGYFGLLNELRNPRQLWHLLDQMCRENPVFSSKLRLRIGGTVAENIKNELSDYKELKGKIEFLGYLPHDGIQQEYQKCNVLLLLLNKSNNSEWILPVKFFEYLAANRMILALGERKSDLGDLMNTKDVGEILAYNEIDGMRGFLEDAFENDRLPNKEESSSLLKRFSHESLVDKLEKLIAE